MDDEKKKTSPNELELKKKIRGEGFLESQSETEEKQTNANKETASSSQKRGIFSFLGGADKKEEKFSKKKEFKEKREQLKSMTKQERKEEKRWKEEAQKREKLLEKKKKEQIKATKNESKKVKGEYKLPKKKKRSAIVKFFTSLNYFGLGKERIAFIDNLATMMDAGLPLLDAIRALQKDTKRKIIRKIIGRIIIAIETGNPLWRAMESQYLFTQQQIAMVRVGEEAGSLTENLRYLAEQEEKDRALRSKVKTAMIYPIIVLVMLTVIVFGLGLFVLPNLVGVIESLNVPLPIVTRIIIVFTEYFSQNAKMIIISFFSGVIVLFFLTKYTYLKVFVQWMIYHIPGIGTLIKEATISRFGVVLGGLLRAGVPVTESLESLTNATSLIRYKKFYAQLLEHVKLGDSFTTSFEAIPLTDKCFPPSVQQLIMTGEKSGSLTEIALKIAEIHDRKASEIAEKLPVIIEPLLLLFIGGLVATIALGILAPIYSIVGNIG